MNLRPLFCAVLNLILPNYFHRCFHCMALLNKLTHGITFRFFWLLVLSRQIKIEICLCILALNSCKYQYKCLSFDHICLCNSNSMFIIVFHTQNLSLQFFFRVPYLNIHTDINLSSH